MDALYIASTGMAATVAHPLLPDGHLAIVGTFLPLYANMQ